MELEFLLHVRKFWNVEIIIYVRLRRLTMFSLEENVETSNRNFWFIGEFHALNFFNLPYMYSSLKQ